MATDPTPATLAGLDDVHARLDRDFPEWNGHLEVDYVSAEAVEAVVRADESHPMIRISPGEPLHEVEASRHYVLNWAAALQADQPIAGAAPSTVLPAIDRRLIHEVVLQHVRAWPEWVRDMQATGGQVYAVLTLCRGGNAGDWTAGVQAGGRQCRQVTVPGMVNAHRLGQRLVVPGRIGLRPWAGRRCAPIRQRRQRAVTTALRHPALLRPRRGLTPPTAASQRVPCLRLLPAAIPASLMNSPAAMPTQKT